MRSSVVATVNMRVPCYWGIFQHGPDWSMASAAILCCCRFTFVPCLVLYAIFLKEKKYMDLHSQAHKLIYSTYISTLIPFPNVQNRAAAACYMGKWTIQRILQESKKISRLDSVGKHLIRWNAFDAHAKRKDVNVKCFYWGWRVGD
jgi:hypothetical protein